MLYKIIITLSLLISTSHAYYDPADVWYGYVDKNGNSVVFDNNGEKDYVINKDGIKHEIEGFYSYKNNYLLLFTYNL